MILILRHNLDMVKMYLYIENELPTICSSNVTAWTDRQTDRPEWNYYLFTYTDGNNIYVFTGLEFVVTGSDFLHFWYHRLVKKFESEAET